MKIERDVSDVRRMLEGSKMWAEHDEIYDKSFIKVNILFIIFRNIDNFFTDSKYFKRDLLGKFRKNQLKRRFTPTMHN